MISFKQKDDYSDKTDTAASELMGEQVQVFCDENAHSSPDNSIPQHPIPCSDKWHEDINNTEDKENLMDGNLKVGVTEDHKLWVYDSKRLASSITRDVYKVVIGTMWSNIPHNKAHSSCDVPTEGTLATQDNSEKQDTPTAEDSPATQQIEDELPTTDSPATPVSSTAEKSPATEIQSSPAMPTRSNPTNLVSDSVSDKEDGPSGEDGESNSTNADIHAIPCGEDQVPPTLSDSKDASDSVQHEEAIASKLNETPVGEKEMNLTPTEVVTAAEANKTPVGEGESDLDCGGPSGQDETEQSRMPLRSDESDIVCGQGKAPVITMGACSGYDNLPTDTKSSIATTGVPLESESDSVIGRPCLDDSAASLDANKVNITSTESTKPSQPSGGASEADAPCVDTPLDSVSDSFNINTPAECHDESSDASEDGSLTEQKIAAVVDSSNSSDTPPTNVNLDDAPCEHKTTETGGTVDVRTGAELEDICHTAGPDGIMAGGTELARQPDVQDTTLVPCGDHTNSPAITEADGNVDNGSGSFTNAVSDDRTDKKSTYSGEECSDFVSSAPRDDAKANSSDTVLPSPSKYEASYIKTSTTTIDIRVPSLLSTVLIVLHFICPAITQDEAANVTSSNITEIDSMTVENSSKSFPVAGQSTMLGVHWIVGIVYLYHFARLFRRYTIVGVVVRACKNACSCIGCLIKRHSGQVVLPLTSATNIQNNATNSVKHLVPPSTPPRTNERFSSSVEALSSRVSENPTSNSKHLLVQQSIDSGYHSMPPMPHSPIALLSGKDGRVRVNGEPLDQRFDQQSTRVQYDVSSEITKLDSVNVLEPVSSPQLTGKNRRTDHSNTKVQCTNAENCDPGESDSFGFHRRSHHTDASGGEVQQETTQPSEHSSELAGLTHRHRERTIQILPPVVIQNPVVSPQVNGEPSPVQTVALSIGLAFDVLAFNAAVEETEHVALDPPEDVPNITPITLESSFIDLERGLRPHVGLADAEVDMFQLQAPPYSRPYVVQGDAADSFPAYPPLPGVPCTNTELQPIFPPLPAVPTA